MFTKTINQIQKNHTYAYAQVQLTKKLTLDSADSYAQSPVEQRIFFNMSMLIRIGYGASLSGPLNNTVAATSNYLLPTAYHYVGLAPYEYKCEQRKFIEPYVSDHIIRVSRECDKDGIPLEEALADVFILQEQSKCETGGLLDRAFETVIVALFTAAKDENSKKINAIDKLLKDSTIKTPEEFKKLTDKCQKIQKEQDVNAQGALLHERWKHVKKGASPDGSGIRSKTNQAMLDGPENWVIKVKIDKILTALESPELRGETDLELRGKLLIDAAIKLQAEQTTVNSRGQIYEQGRLLESSERRIQGGSDDRKTRTEALVKESQAEATSTSEAETIPTSSAATTPTSPAEATSTAEVREAYNNVLKELGGYTESSG